MSQTVDKNSCLLSVIEKKSGNQTKEALTSDYNMISKSSNTAKNYPYQGYARRKLFKCKECHVWTCAVNETENKYAVLLNNRVKDHDMDLGLLTAKQNVTTGVSVPILQKVKLNIPF